MLDSIFNSEQISLVGIGELLACLGSALLLGLIIALAYSLGARYSGGFAVTLAILPAVVCVVIMAVNGNIGAGVAVAGAFSLVRFRSAAGSAEEILMIFITMASGLLVGMGYIGISFISTAIMCAVFVLYGRIALLVKKKEALHKSLKITVPEDLDYPGAFDRILERYTSRYELTRVKTANMGSILRLTYDIRLIEGANEKELIDELRIRNGNLEIALSERETERGEL